MSSVVVATRRTAGLLARRSAALGRHPGGIRAATSPLPSALVAAAMAVVAARLGWRGADSPNHLFRIDLFRRAGFTVWSSAWYGGHHTPAYSVLLPPLGALLGPALLGGASAVLAAACFDRLLRRAADRLPLHPSPLGLTLGSLLFAAGTVTNLAVGRLAFALGLALGLAALLAGCRRWPWAAGLSIATALASPVAGGFLLLAWAALAIGHRSRPAVLLGAVTGVPVVALALVFPEGGTFPFRWPALLGTLLASAAALVLLPPSVRALRAGAVLYAGAALAVFVAPNPLGANVTRLAAFVLAPLLVAFAPRARLLAALVPALLWWQWSPAVDGMLRSGRDSSTQPAYYQPLLDFLQAQPAPVARVEIPFTRRHFEAAYVAPAVPLARGWERQLDMKVNALFYVPGALDAESYGAWLRDTGVEYVALPDGPLDPSATAEARLLRQGQPYLEPVWQEGRWRVWRVLDSPGLVDGPARLVAFAADTVAVDARAAGTVLIRVRWTALWSVDGPACARPSAEGWVLLDVQRPGRLVLHPVLLGQRAHCPA